MKWADLGEMIQKMTPEQLNCDVAVKVDDEFYSGCDANMIERHDSDVLGCNEPYLDLNTLDVKSGKEVAKVIHG